VATLIRLDEHLVENGGSADHTSCGERRTDDQRGHRRAQYHPAYARAPAAAVG
jgi:hypothetical protein